MGAMAIGPQRSPRCQRCAAHRRYGSGDRMAAPRTGTRTEPTGRLAAEVKCPDCGRRFWTTDDDTITAALERRKETHG